MVFSSLPAYLDASNWNQQQHQSHQAAGSSDINPHPHPHHIPLQPPPPLPPPSQQQPQHGPVGGGGNIRPGSMAERARLANIPMPETALKCPRCESTNTKFCYFNNYSLSQPRHFCKTCRRYWTRGGALRNVPVGGGFRRNKRSKSSSSNKSDQQTTTSASGGSVSNNSSSNNMMGSRTGSATGTTAEILGLTAQLPSLGFMTPLHHHHQLDEFNSNRIGLNYGGLSTQPLGGITGDLGFQLCGGSSSGGSGNGNSLLSAAGAGGMEQWRIQQFPYLSNLDLQAGLYPSYESGGESSSVLSNTLTSGVASQLASVKMEGTNNNSNNNQELNLSRQMVGIQGNEQFWSTSERAWIDLSGFSPSSTSNNNAI